MTDRSPNLIAYPLMACAALFWAGNIVVARAFHAEVPPVGLSFWRWVLAFALFLPFTLALTRRQWPLIRRHWRWLALLGLLGGLIFHTFLYVALNTTTALNAALIYAMTPALVPVVAQFMLGDRLHALQIAGTALSLGGVVIVVARGDINALLGLQFTRGDIWMVGAVVSWAFYSVLIKRKPADMHPNTMLTGMMMMAITMTLPVYLWEHLTIRVMPATASSLAVVGYIAVFASIAAYLCYNRAIALVGPSRTALTAHMLPIFAAALSVAFLGEVLHLYHLAGAVAVAGGIGLASMASPSGAAPAKPSGTT
jgi:drug/metabolite transporter (DMT)-like permease